MRLWRFIDDAILGQRDNLFCWAPVFFALGIALYFHLKVEPGPAVYALLFAGCLIAGAVARKLPDGMRALVIGVVIGAIGFTVAGARAHFVAEPVLGFRYYGPVEGRIIKIDRSGSDAVRLTLDQVIMEDIAPSRQPTRVRISLHGPQGFVDPVAGQHVMMTAHLSPPGGPVEPGGFDFRRMSWFMGLGAIGYTRTPVLLASSGVDGDWRLWIYALRRSLSDYVQSALPGETGAFAAAITTGDRSGMGQETLRDLRASNLAHLLAISGLHMGLLTGFVFAATRVGLALVPGIALRVQTKKIAAIIALIAGAAYFALSGGNVATERAFIMVTVMLSAVLLDRRAVTLRAVAIAALIVLLLRPEALSGPGFQMSFAATTALVAVFGALRRLELTRYPRWIRSIGAVVLSSAVAGLATAPFAAAHFNQIAHYGLVANLLSVPVMGLLVMPSAVLTALLAPFGLDWIGFALMEIGINWILSVADWTASQEGAVGHVVTPRPGVLLLLALGALLLILWQGRARLAGPVMIVAASGLWANTQRPTVLIAESGALIGIMGAEGRALSKPRGDGFVAQIWLENDGNPVPQETAFERPSLVTLGRHSEVEIAGQRLISVRGKGALNALESCDGADILITDQSDDIDRACRVFDRQTLRHVGSVAGYLENGQLRLITARDISGERLWSSSAIREGQASPRAGLRLFSRFGSIRQDGPEP